MARSGRPLPRRSRSVDIITLTSHYERRTTGGVGYDFDGRAAQGGGLRNQFAEKAEDSEDVELTYLFSAVLFEELIALMIGDVLLAVISFLIVGFYMCVTAQSARGS